MFNYQSNSKSNCSLTNRSNYIDYKNKDKIKKQVKNKANKIKRSLKNKKVGLKTRFFFNMFGMTQKNGWNKTDSDFWKNKGWLEEKKPY